MASGVGYRSGDAKARQDFEKFSDFSAKIKNIANTFDPNDLLSVDLEVIKKDSLAFRVSNFFNSRSDSDYHSEALDKLLQNFTEINQTIVEANGHSYTSDAQRRGCLPEISEMSTLIGKIGTLKNKVLASASGDERIAWETAFRKLENVMGETQDRLNLAQEAKSGLRGTKSALPQRKLEFSEGAKLDLAEASALAAKRSQSAVGTGAKSSEDWEKERAKIREEYFKRLNQS